MQGLHITFQSAMLVRVLKVDLSIKGWSLLGSADAHTFDWRNRELVDSAWSLRWAADHFNCLCFDKVDVCILQVFVRLFV